MSELPLASELPRLVMQRDLFRLQKSLAAIQRHPNPEALAGFHQSFAISRQRRTDRTTKLPRPILDETLPVFERAGEIRELLQRHQVLILSGETGSGKSTQLPLIALQAGIGTAGLIGHTQPRRIAARSVAERIAALIGTPLGTDVGFKVRFSDQTSDATYVKLMTDGILLAETQTDRFLDQYEMLIVDEAHERSLNIDFVLGFLRNLLPRRPQLKVVITSATIDTQKFAEHFCNAAGEPAPVMHVAGRTYPVDVQYREPNDPDSENSMQQMVVEECRQLIKRRDGDVLVFLPTEVDIRNVAKKLRGALTGSPIEILPLYARLSPAQQSEVFRPHAHGRIVLATNVAESSITVPGIRYVVDTGTARISRYAAKTKIQRLPIEPISQASANQRAGRCGRVAPGICVRLYSQEDFLSRPEFTTPEIRRTNLAGTILQLLSLKLGNVEDFPFIDPPNTEAIRDGYKTLFEIGAVDNHRNLTPQGRKLSRLPVDPRIGRMILAGDANNCLNDILVIAAALELQDPRIRPAEKQAAADAAHQQWNDPESDFLAILKLWDFLGHLKETLSRSRFRTALEQNFLSHSLVVQWQDIHRQLLEIATDNGLVVRKRTNDRDAIHRSLLPGLLSSVAMLEDRNEYLGAGGIRFQLWPGSGVFQARPKWIVAAEIIETTKRYGRTIAAIKPEWIEPIAEHLLKRSQVDPFWSSKGQTVMAYQNTSLFGLPIRVRQRVNFTKIDPAASRQLFIEEGLVAGQMQHEFNFHLHNQLLINDVDSLAKKTRQRQLIIDSAAIVDFYRQRLPDEAVDVRSLIELLRQDPDLDRRLQLDYEDLGLSSATVEAADQLPDRVRVGNVTVPVEYQFQPGSETDGANVRLPREAIGQIDDLQMGWLIPGLLQERIAAMIRSLPKNVRRNLVPAPDVARQVVEQIKFGEGSFPDAVAKALSRIAGVPISANQFDTEKIDRHLMVNVVVEDEAGKPIAQGRSLAEIRGQLGPMENLGQIEIDNNEWNRSGFVDWTWGDLPTEVPIVRGNTRLVAYPAIIDEGSSVALRLVDSPDKARILSEGGLLRLFSLKQKKNIRSQVQWLPDLEKAKMQIARWIKPDWFSNWLGQKIVAIGMIEGQPPIMKSSEFVARNVRAVELISVATQEIAAWLPKLAGAAQSVSLQLQQTSGKYGESLADVREQLHDLFAEETLTTVPWRWLQHYPRYLQAIAVRLQKLPATPLDQDRQNTALIRKYRNEFDRLKKVHEQNGWVDLELVKFRWMVEEFRVSKFAQNLGTSLTVSDKRLDKMRESVRQS